MACQVNDCIQYLHDPGILRGSAYISVHLWGHVSETRLPSTVLISLYNVRVYQGNTCQGTGRVGT